MYQALCLAWQWESDEEWWCGWTLCVAFVRTCGRVVRFIRILDLTNIDFVMHAFGWIAIIVRLWGCDILVSCEEVWVEHQKVLTWCVGASYRQSHWLSVVSCEVVKCGIVGKLWGRVGWTSESADLMRGCFLPPVALVECGKLRGCEMWVSCEEVWM